MKITKRQLVKIISEELMLEREDAGSFEPRAPTGPHSDDVYEQHFFARRQWRGRNILGEWICMRGIPGGEGEKSWGWLKIGEDGRTVQYGDRNSPTTARITSLRVKYGKTFEPNFTLRGIRKDSEGRNLEVNVKASVGPLGVDGWREVPGDWATTRIKSLISDLYRTGTHTISFEKAKRGPNLKIDLTIS